MKIDISVRKKAVYVGVMILLAYGVLVGSITTSKIWIMIADVISGLAVIGIAAIMYPFFKVAGEKISLSYLLLKILEGALMIIAGILFLNNSFQYFRDWIYNGIHLYTFISSAFIFYYLLSKTKLVPKYISIWGTFAIFALSTKTILSLFSLSFPVFDIMLVLIITNEIFLAIWLMIKGFSLPAVKSKSVD